MTSARSDQVGACLAGDVDGGADPLEVRGVGHGLGADQVSAGVYLSFRPPRHRDR